MKLSLLLIIIICALSACKNQQQKDAEKLMEQIQTTVKQNTPGTIATTNDGYMMKAKLDGKDWEAGSMMPPDAAGRIIGYNDGEYIGLSYERRELVVGKKIVFSENDAADLATNDDIGMWSGKKGEMEITKVDDNWAEGKFFFTGSSSRSSETIEVTDGFFRIPLEKN